MESEYIDPLIHSVFYIDITYFGLTGHLQVHNLLRLGNPLLTVKQFCFSSAVASGYFGYVGYPPVLVLVVLVSLSWTCVSCASIWFVGCGGCGCLEYSCWGGSFFSFVVVRYHGRLLGRNTECQHRKTTSEFNQSFTDDIKPKRKVRYVQCNRMLQYKGEGTPRKLATATSENYQPELNTC
jgi:hypothetical protein